MTSPSTYIITGASAGIGLACVRLLASQGANVVLLARRYDQLCAIQASLPNPEHHLSIRCDVSHKADVEAAIAQAVARYGHIDAIICNAGVGLTGPIATLAYADILACFEVNVAGVLHSIQACLPHFRRQGAGQFVVISSVVGVLGLPYNGGYCASKGAVERLCDAFRVELIGSPLHLSVVRPGTVASEFFQHRLGPNGETRRQRAGIPRNALLTRSVRCSATSHASPTRAGRIAWHLRWPPTSPRSAIAFWRARLAGTTKPPTTTKCERLGRQ